MFLTEVLAYVWLALCIAVFAVAVFAPLWMDED
jgi:hypothetical protein